MKTLRILYTFTLIPLLFSTGLLADVNRPQPDIPKKEWNFLVYMANNNNLHRFGVQNFRQMTQVGSTPNINVLLQMDHFGQRAISRFFVEKNSPNLLESHSNTATSFSGTQANLVDFARWGTKNFKSDSNCLVLWNHGAGIKDSEIWGKYLIRNRDDLFALNERTGLWELDHSIKNNRKLLADLDRKNKQRGIAFNDEAEEYINNQDLKDGLAKICSECLNGKKIEILAMDACHMAMVEVASQIKDSVKIMVASEEVEPGSGYHYVGVLSPFTSRSMSHKDFAQHLVRAYHEEYKGTLGDYTQSAVDLSFIGQLEQNINSLALQLIDALAADPKNLQKDINSMRTSRSATTEFFDPDYVDLGHLYKSLAAIAPKAVKDVCVNGLDILKKMVIENVAGRNLSNASGLSIYFPKRSIHRSYYKTEFAKVTAWPRLLETLIKTKAIDTKTAQTIQEKTAGKKKARGNFSHAHHDDHAETGKACCGSCADKAKATGKKVTCCSK